MAIKKEQIVQAVKTRLETITTANGYHTNLGSNIYEWKQNPHNETDVLAAVIRDTDCEEVNILDQSSSGIHTKILSMEIEIIAASSTVPAVLRQAEADVNKAIGTDTTFGGLAIDTTPVNSIPLYPNQNEKRIAGLQRTVEIHFRTVAWQES